MSDMHVRFKAYDSAGVFQGFLTPSSWSASVQHNDAGTLSMTYPRVSLNGGILQRGLEQCRGVPRVPDPELVVGERAAQ